MSVIRTIGGLLAVGLALGACGTQTGSPGDPVGAGDPVGPGDAGATTTQTRPRATGPGPTGEPGQVYGTFGTILQEPGGDPMLCVGGVAESYPPQCGGPVLVGLDWSDVTDREEASGVTWGTGWAVGTYDGTQVTLTRPVSADPPEGLPEREDPYATDFSTLCEDPYEQGDAAFATESPEGMAGQEALIRQAEGLDGYVTLYLSPDQQVFNVVVNQDAPAAREALREVWGGGLCVAEQDAPTEQDSRAAQEELAELWEPLGLLGVGTSGVDGRLIVDVTVADPATVQQIHEAVSPWLDPDDVVVVPALVELPD